MTLNGNGNGDGDGDGRDRRELNMMPHVVALWACSLACRCNWFGRSCYSARILYFVLCILYFADQWKLR